MNSKSKLISAVCAATVIGALGTVAVGAATGASRTALAATSPKTNAGPASFDAAPHPLGASLADMVEAVGPAVVQIQVVSSGRGASSQDEFGRSEQSYDDEDGSGDDEAAPVRRALGSGFVIDPSGVILTNNHVVDGADQVTVKFSDGRQFAAEVLGTDPKTDLAVIKVRGAGRFETIRWGDSDHLRVGEGVFAVGSPFGLGNTVTSGILSAKDREIGSGPYDDYLQVDAAINSGNSGGPLFDTQGRVVGVNSAIYSPSGGNVGIGFAIPSSTARAIAGQIIQDGMVSRGRIGVVLKSPARGEPGADAIAPQKGGVVAEVEPGSPADQAGLRAGDVVTTFNGHEVADGRSLARIVAEAKVGSVVKATVERAGKAQTFDLRIAGADAARLG